MGRDKEREMEIDLSLKVDGKEQEVPEVEEEEEQEKDQDEQEQEQANDRKPERHERDAEEAAEATTGEVDDDASVADQVSLQESMKTKEVNLYPSDKGSALSLSLSICGPFIHVSYMHHLRKVNLPIYT